MNNLKLDERLCRIEKLLLGNKKVLSFDEAADYTGISKSYLYKLTSLGKIPFSKPGGKIIYFDKDKLDKWMLQNQRLSEFEIEQSAINYIQKNKHK